MQYLQMMYTYAPAWGFGGPSRMMYDYARWMARKGAGADVIAGDIHHDYTANPSRNEVLDGIRIRRVRVFLRSLVKRSLNVVTPTMFLVGLRRVTQVRDVTVIHIAELRSPVFLYAALLRRLFSRRVVLVHSAFGMLHDKPSRVRRLFDPLLMGFLLRSVDLGLAQNDHEADVYRDYCRRYGASGTRVALLPLHTPGPHHDGSTGEAAALRSEFRSRYGVSADALVCIFLGRLHPEKGILRAIDAFLAFARDFPGRAEFLVVGRDDGFQTAIEARIAELGEAGRIRVVNDVYQQRFEYYALADVFLGFPTIFEETMLSSVEALSCGTPVVVSREADLPFVASGGAGFVVDFSVATAAACIAAIAADQPGFRTRARAVAAEHFTERSACAALQELIETAARERRKDRLT